MQAQLREKRLQAMCHVFPLKTGENISLFVAVFDCFTDQGQIGSSRWTDEVGIASGRDRVSTIAFETVHTLIR
jgi:hypothetical protein